MTASGTQLGWVTRSESVTGWSQSLFQPKLLWDFRTKATTAGLQVMEMVWVGTQVFPQCGRTLLGVPGLGPGGTGGCEG